MKRKTAVEKTDGQKVLMGVIQQVADDLQGGMSTDLTLDNLHALRAVVPQVKPALTEAFDRIGWALFAKQRLTLGRMVALLHDTAAEQEGDKPDVTRDQITQIEGMMNMLDEVAAAAEQDGYPVAHLVANCHCQDCGRIWAEEELREIPSKHFHERVAPGEPMSAGECPVCGALCQVKA